jgi:hypothetical protein
MEIVNIFAPSLFAVQYKGEKMNELRRLLNQWNDTAYLFDFLKEHKADKPRNITVENLIEQISEDANDIDDTLNAITTNQKLSLENFFKPLNNNEYRLDVQLSKQKGRRNYLRIYAIKIDSNCFLITGGAIKFTLKMQDREHTKKELLKIEKCKNYLKENGVNDEDSFFEFLNERL